MRPKSVWLLILGVVWVAGCLPVTAEPVPDQSISTATSAAAPVETLPGLTAAEHAAITSLEKISDHPLYTMRFAPQSALQRAPQSAPPGAPAVRGFALQTGGDPPWGCSLFAALGDSSAQLFGRNFDWRFSPAVLLFYHPPESYTSMAIVDIEYLGYDAETSRRLDELPLERRRGLLNTPLIPFDGMNEQGLAIGMAAVPPGEMRPDPAKPTIGSLGVMRRALDSAATVEEALAIFEAYNVDMGEGPPIHYLVADRTGAAILIEYYMGEMFVKPNDQPWHLATNFLVSSAEGKESGMCWRYDTLATELAEAGGALDSGQALGLLAGVAQDSTEWSAVYNLNTAELHLVMGRGEGRVFNFSLQP